jgi:hypothetical protein
MSLRFWLPFNNNLINSGLDFSAITASSTSLTYDVGKVCPYAWNSSSAWLKIPYDYANTNQMTIAFWVKPNSPVAWSDVFSFGTDTLNRMEKGDSNNTNYYWYGSTFPLIQSGTLLFTIDNSIWTHVTMTADGSEVKFYINGALRKTAPQLCTISEAFNGSNTFIIAARNLQGNMRYSSYLNDFRIYDHTLTLKEVKLLSQGLVAHYQLKGMGRTNYLKGAGLYTEHNPLIRNASDVSHMYDSYTYHNGTLSVTIPTSGTYSFVLKCDGFPTGHSTSGTVGASRLFSMWLQNTSTGDHYLWSGYNTSATGEHYGIFASLPSGTYNVRTNLYSSNNENYTLKFWNMKVVQGEYDPNDIWCPNSEDELYSTLGLNSALGTDCSGYCNNLSQVGTISVVGNGSRYGRCVDFNQTGYLKNNNFGMITNQFTMSFWFNAPSSTNNQHFLFGTHNSWTNNGFSGWRDANGENYSTLVKSSAESSHTGISFPAEANKWTHIAYVYTGTELVYYKNGIEQSRKTYGLGGTVSHPVMYLGNSRYSEVSSQIDEACMSDFRFYVTALSFSDIADLYNNSASLTKNGKLLAYDFHETSRDSIDKNGVVSSGGFNDDAIPIYDMRLKTLGDGTVWARIHWLDVTTNKSWFTKSEVDKCLNQNNRYSRMGVVDKYKYNGEYEFMLTYPSMSKTLPNGYTRLDYIEATGDQYIKTNVKGYARWEFDIQFTDTTTRQLMGYGGSGSEYWGVKENGKYEIYSTMNVLAGERDTVVHDYSKASRSIWVKNTALYAGDTDVTEKEYQLLAIDGGARCKAKLWRCKCIQNGSLIRDFIPAKRNSDGVVGLLDVVNNVFYTNAGSGTFAYGSTKDSSIELYNRWIQTSSPNEYSGGGVVSGYKSITTSWVKRSGGLRKNNGNQCVYRCDPHDTNWYAPIGQLYSWTDTNYIPAADETSQTETELWVRIDRFNNETELNIYDGAMTATDYMEI